MELGDTLTGPLKNLPAVPALARTRVRWYEVSGFAVLVLCMNPIGIIDFGFLVCSTAIALRTIVAAT